MGINLNDSNSVKNGISQLTGFIKPFIGMAKPFIKKASPKIKEITGFSSDDLLSALDSCSYTDNNTSTNKKATNIYEKYNNLW